MDRFFDNFRALFGAKFTSQFDDPKFYNIWLVTWANGLKGLTKTQMLEGLKKCVDLAWPPSIGEFRALCRSEHQPNYETLFHEAAKLAAQQVHGVEVNWPSALLYWSAEAFGWDELRFATWGNCQRQWTAAVDEMLKEEILPPIPAQQALPAPGKSCITMEDVGRLTRALAAEMKMGNTSGEVDEWGLTPERQWVKTVHLKHTARQSMQAAEAALKRFGWDDDKVQRFKVKVWDVGEHRHIERV